VLTYLHFDVFTNDLLTGNQLAVFLEPRAGIAPELMQALAREMAFSESTFVFPPERPDTDMRVRIFTPSAELPMAGHPTIGTAFALAHAGRLAPGQPRVVFGEGVGPVPVDLEWQDGRLAFAWMTQPRPQFGATLGATSALAAALGLTLDDLETGLPLQLVSCGGEPFVLVPIRTRAAIDRSSMDGRAWADALQAQNVPVRPVYVFSLEPAADAAAVYSRMFAPMLGIQEDAATGSASGPLGAYLARYRGMAAQQPIINLQGVRMNRPSRIHIRAVVDGTGGISAVRVGGTAVLAGTGTVQV
jgi:trans-2,3-dihydro-3-hydroxyanthranilate isomerase